MKTNIKHILVAVTVVLGTAFASQAGNNESEKQTHVLNKEKSALHWVGKKVSGQHSGTIEIKSGGFAVKNGIVTDGEFTADMRTIQVTDLQGDYKGKLEGHLKSPDFFDVVGHPIATFRTTSIIPIEGVGSKGHNVTVTADLTIKGITKQVTFPARIVVAGSKVIARGDLVFDRTDYDIKYGSGKFFDSLGDNMISDEVTFNFVIIADQKEGI